MITSTNNSPRSWWDWQWGTDFQNMPQNIKLQQTTYSESESFSWSNRSSVFYTWHYVVWNSSEKKRSPILDAFICRVGKWQPVATSRGEGLEGWQKATRGSRCTWVNREWQAGEEKRRDGKRQRGEGKGKSIKSSNMNCALKWLLKSHQESKWEVKCSGEHGRRLPCVLQQHWLYYSANFCSTLTAKQCTLQGCLCSHIKIFIPMAFMFVSFRLGVWVF